MRCRGILLAFLAGAMSCVAGPGEKGSAGVILREEVLEVPTYPVGPPEAHPIFFDGRSYQGAKGPIYPYPLLDRLSTVCEPRKWKAVRLENRYVEILVLPEIGGRLFAARDKSNGYDFFYRQHVIKPALIGMAGAWISGGVEWNVFHHHRVTSFMPVDHFLEEHPDGSKTVWIGETELRHRMRWVLGLTLYPDRSCLEVTVRLFNRTPLPHSFLFFANAAVSVNDRYQVIFPPRTEWATSHAKDQFVEWPVARRAYKGVDYRGVDLSWIRNHPDPNSFFAWNEEDDFVAGYDHGRRAGVIHVADHRVVPGKKLWQWGTGPTGRVWERILTDADGPYAEIMTGAYSDNQPDYSWLGPGETKVFRQYWYPIRELGGVKQATVEGAVNLEVVRQGLVRLGFNTTREHPAAKVRLEAGGRILLEKEIGIGPDRPFVEEVPLPEGIREEELRAALTGLDGRELVAYSPVKPPGEPMPEPYRPPPAPGEMKTVEELYLAGSRLEQFYDPHREPDPYYEEALRRDPGDVRANLALGLLYLKRGLYPEAVARFREAVRRTTANHTKARDGGPHYYLGVALRRMGREEEAARALARASWDRAYAGPSWLALAEVACRKGDWEDARGCLERALSVNALDPRALSLQAAVFRRGGAMAEALGAAARALALDPLDPFAGNERILSSGLPRARAESARRALLGDSPQPYLELSCDYEAAGMLPEALEVLEGVPRPDAMVHYHRGWILDRLGRKEEAAAAYRQGSEAPWAGCFPFRWESEGALRAALKANPKDARARLYLGNFYYDSQPDRAVEEWEQAVRLDAGLWPAHRNLGYAYLRRGEEGQAVEAYEAALGNGGREDPLVLMELDQAAERAGVPPERRLRPLEENREVVLRRDRTVARLARLYVILGRYDEALPLLSGTHFHLWEGEAGMYGLYAEARIFRGMERLRNGRAREALEDFEAALEVPPNIEVWSEFTENHPRIHFLMGMALRALGEEARGREFLSRAAAAGRAGRMAYYSGLALAELGRTGEAERVFTSLVEWGRRRASARPESGGFRAREEARRRVAEGHYAAGLGWRGLGRLREAEAEFREAVRRDGDHVGAWRALKGDGAGSSGAGRGAPVFP